MLIANKEIIRTGNGLISVSIDKITEFYQLLIEYYETNIPDRLKEFLVENCLNGVNLSGN